MRILQCVLSEYMNTHRINITIPKALVSKLRDKPNKSAYIAEAVKEKLAAEERAQGAEILASAYRSASREEESLLGDWDGVSGDSL